jgi:hypothetical protein
MERIAFVRASLVDEWPCTVVCVTIAFAATFLSQHYGGPQLLYALLIGLAFDFLHGNPQISEGIDAFAHRVPLAHSQGHGLLIANDTPSEGTPVCWIAL